MKFRLVSRSMRFVHIALIAAIGCRASAQGFTATVVTGSSYLSSTSTLYGSNAYATTTSSPLSNGTGYKFSFEAGAEGTPDDGYQSSNVHGTLYVTWKVTGPATGSSYNVILQLVGKQGWVSPTYAYAGTGASDQTASGLASGPLIASQAAASGTHHFSDQNYSNTSSITNHSVTLDSTGVGYVTVPFLGQCEAIANPGSNWVLDLSSEAYGYFEFSVDVSGVGLP